MGVLHSLSDAGRCAIQAFIATCQELRVSYNLTVENVAQRFRISTRQVQRLAQSGALKGSQIERRSWFTEQELARYIQANTYTGGIRQLPEGAE